MTEFNQMLKTKHQQFIKAIKYIYQHIDEPITLDTLANEIHLSVASLKRLFENRVGESPGVFIRRLKMELAFKTLHAKDSSILEVALASGFENHSAFTRTFKQVFGYSPKYARKTMNIISELACIELEAPDIVELQDISLQAVTQTGNYFESAPTAWQRLKNLLSDNELSDDFTGLFIGIGHDNPHEEGVGRSETRFSACVAFDRRDLGIKNIVINNGMYARFHYKGKLNNLGMAYHYIYGRWAENSAYKINNQEVTFNCFLQFPEADKEETCMIHVPLLINFD